MKSPSIKMSSPRPPSRTSTKKSKSSSSTSSPAKMSPIPQQLVIGQGGFGKVFLIEHPTKRGKEALKKKFSNLEYYSRTRDRMNSLSGFLRGLDHQQRYFGGLIVEHSPRGLVMQDAGTSLDKILRKMMRGPEEDHRKFLKDIIKAFPNLLKALQLMNRNKIVHGDIKLANVVWDDETKQLRFIDYDFMGHEDEYEAFSRSGINFPHTPKNVFYLPWPLERYFQPGITLNDFLQFIRFNLERFLPPAWYAHVINYYILEQPQEMPSKIDLYSLGILAYQLFYNPRAIRLLGGASKQKQEEVRKLLETIIFRQMIYPNPSQRRIPLDSWNNLIRLVSTERRPEHYHRG